MGMLLDNLLFVYYNDIKWCMVSDIWCMIYVILDVWYMLYWMYDICDIGCMVYGLLGCIIL